MTNDEYLLYTLSKYNVNIVGAKAASNTIYPIIQKWSSGYLIKAHYSGSMAKGTSISLSTDADIFISLSSNTPNSLQSIYDSLHVAVVKAGYPVRKQNVSIGTTVNSFKIDLVPGRRQGQYGNDHSLCKNKTKTWTKTNVNTHINTVTASRRIDEIKLTKIWRELHSLSFPSFYLELVVIEALKYSRFGDLASNFLKVLDFMRDELVTKRYLDPANTNNVISDELNRSEKQLIASKAAVSRGQSNWSGIVW